MVNFRDERFRPVECEIANAYFEHSLIWKRTSACWRPWRAVATKIMGALIERSFIERESLLADLAISHMMDDAGEAASGSMIRQRYAVVRCCEDGVVSRSGDQRICVLEVLSSQPTRPTLKCFIFSTGRLSLTSTTQNS